ncbi:MAG TPA: protein kinase [Bryobacteraceae bacterium]|nr:protein kinase [Bryobacteraceae bacterium]
MKNPRARRVRLGEFEIDLHAGELFATGIGDSEPILLRRQPLEVLQMLMEAGGDVVTRQDIKKKLWPNDTNVNFDHSINVVIGILRRVLRDSADNPQYIETLARRGYRLRVAVEWLETDKGTASSKPPGPLSPTEPSLIGTKVAHYQVLELIGAGGMGMVYKAEDLKLARRVALKFLPEELANEPLPLKRFEREARTASALNHPNICTIYQIDEYEGRPFIAMELLEGDSLLHRLASSGMKATALDSLLDIAIQICAGLQAAHDLGIIHRDIKPGNLFLTRRGQVKILDFGLAKAIASTELVAGNLPGAREAAFTNAQIPTAVQAILSNTELPMGTTGYMSPEQLRNDPLDPRTDLFSFGIVLYEMMTGRHPFEGTVTAVHDAILAQNLLPAHNVNSAIPRRLGAIIAKATEKDRNRRYQSAAEIRADLESVRQSLRPARAPSRMWLAAGALFALLAAAAGIYWRSHSRIALSPNQTIVIGVSNRTRDSAFNDALYHVLQVAMEQTPYFTLLPLTKATSAVNALHLSEDPMKLSPQAARQVCAQTGSKLAITGSIVEAGNGLGLKLQGIECESGRTIAAVSGEAHSRAQVVRTLGEETAELRLKLGEPTASVARFNKPLDAATSGSPEALQMLLEGHKRHLVSDFPGAILNYQRALNLDPNLAEALTVLAAAQNTLDNDGGGIAAIKKSYELRNRLTDPARFETESLYYFIVTGEKDKESAVLSQFVQRFPDNFIAHTNFSQCLSVVGQLDRSLAEARESSRLYPSPLSYANVINLELLTDRLDEAEAKFAEADAQKFDSVFLRKQRARLAFLRHDNSKMQEQWAWAEGKPGADFRMLWLRGLMEAYYGHYRNARSLLARARELAIKENARSLIVLLRADDALTEAEAGNLTEALQLAEEGLKGSPVGPTRPVFALTFARAGQTARAQELADSINSDHPLHTEIQNYLLPTIQAAIKIHAEDPAAAIQILERTKQYDFAYPQSFQNLYPAYMRGLAYLQLGEASLARIEFQKLLDHPGLVEENVIGALSHLQLARAIRLSGDTAAARKAYEDFLTLWKNADADIPVYQEAKAEYARLSPLPAMR